MCTIDPKTARSPRGQRFGNSVATTMTASSPSRVSKPRSAARASW